MRADNVRTVLVVAERPYLWSALHSDLDEELIRLRWVGEGQLRAHWSACRPWPWVVVVNRPVSAELISLAAALPIPIRALGTASSTLASIQLHDSWQSLAGALRDSLLGSIGGMTLAPRRGIRTPDGQVIQPAPEVEGLIAAHPGALEPAAWVRRAERTIAAHSLPCRIQRREGEVRLIPARIANGLGAR